MPGVSDKSSPSSVKTGGQRRKDPSVYRKSPEAAMSDLFKTYLGPKSDVIEALTDNGLKDALKTTTKSVEKNTKDLKTHSTLNKKLVKGIVDSSTKLSTVVRSLETISNRQKAAAKSPKQTQTEKNIRETSKHLSTVSASLSKMRALLVRQHRDILDRSLHQESDAYETKLRDQKQQQNTYTPTFSSPSRGLNPLEARSTALFGKGFHFVTGAISEILQKKILHNKSSMMQENKQEEDWSPQHRNYIRTKDQLSSLLSIFKSEKKKAATTPKKTEASEETAPVVEKLDHIDKTVQKGDEKVVKSVNSVNGTLKTIAQYFVTQNQMMEDEETESALRRTRLEKDKKKEAPPVIVNNVNQNGGGMLGSALKAGAAILSGAKKVAAAAASGAAAAKAMLLRPVGLAAGVATIGTAAVGAAYFMDKYSREMMDAETDQVKSGASLSMQRNRMKRQNPQAYELVKIRDKIENMSVLRDNQKDPVKKARTQAAIDEMKARYQDKYRAFSSQDATDQQPDTNAAPTPEKSSTPGKIAAGAASAGLAIAALSKTSSATDAGSNISKIPIAAGALGAGVATAGAMRNAMPEKSDTAFAGVVNELRSGRLASILEDIREGIKELKGSLMPQRSGVTMINGQSASVGVTTKSSIAQQRDSLR